jgi:hypothetical protein
MRSPKVIAASESEGLRNVWGMRNTRALKHGEVRVTGALQEAWNEVLE